MSVWTKPGAGGVTAGAGDSPLATGAADGAIQEGAGDGSKIVVQA